MHIFSTQPLRAVSYLAPNLFYLYEAVVQFWGRSLGIQTNLVQAALDPLVDPALREDEVDVAFICGLPLVRLWQRQDTLNLIAAPILEGARYGGQPVYFADVIVQADSNFGSIHDLAGQTFCYNDEGSNSGYRLMYLHLEFLQQPLPFFRQTAATGSHQRSIRWVIEGLADCAAIDSTVLEQELRDFPELAPLLRVIESIGPAPMPPIVASNRLGEQFQQHLQKSLLQPDDELKSAMTIAQVKGYQSVEWLDYRAIAISLP